MNIKKQKETIIKFMKWKSRLIANETGVKGFWNKQDSDHIMSLKGIDVKTITTELTASMFTAIGIKDENICPYCILHNAECGECSYGERHGE